MKEEGRNKRKLRNYLLDKRFQLKYTGLVLIISLFLSVILGYFLYREIVASEETLLAKELGANVIVVSPGEAEKVIEAQNAIQNEFNRILKTDAEETIIVKLLSQPSKKEILPIEEEIEKEKIRKRNILIGSLGVFLVFLLLGGIYLTHRIAGPAYKMKLLFNKIDGRKLKVEGRLRKRDELKDVFQAFVEMIQRISEFRVYEIELIERILKEYEEKGQISEESISSLKKLKEELTTSIK